MLMLLISVRYSTSAYRSPLTSSLSTSKSLHCATASTILQHAPLRNPARANICKTTGMGLHYNYRDGGDGAGKGRRGTTAANR